MSDPTVPGTDVGRRGRPMRALGLGVLLALALALAGCGGGDEQGTSKTAKTAKSKTATTRTRAPERPPPLPAGASGRAAEGRKLVIATGCLACHEIGGKGASKPGESLDGIGSRRSDAELRQALVQPRKRMPSYSVLGDGKLGQIVAYLSALRGGDG